MVEILTETGGKTLTLYTAEKTGSPLIILNNYSGDGSEVVSEMRKIGCPDCNLLSVGNLDWNHDMTPWDCPAFNAKGEPYNGGADEYLALLLDQILPKALARIDGVPSFIGLAGYSLAGLFALYAMYRTDRFERIASMSGSLWFPDFKEYAKSNELISKPKRIYLSVGDGEAKTKNPVLKSVRKNTGELAQFYEEQGINVVYELNPGNHFRDAALRCAKGIVGILE